ncbi:leucine-rich repeat neuronal protein 2-like [Anopheles cruzii]|uniref:leucine-rich repeat neuronal protein 2-like n=1 Tax=Anopheles cruzii TaxID=68878 RepID=UPI0022EC971A|nr:leucine-rich repeat neuronal protein 2-like [Anopheles cruzii]
MSGVRPKRWVYFALVLVALHSRSISAGEETNEPQATTEAAANATTPAWMPYLEVQEGSSNSSVLCKNCTCNASNATFDCTNVKLESTTSFPPEAWLSLNASGFVPKTILLKATGLRQVVRFPPMNVTLLDLSYNEIQNIEAQCFIDLAQLEVLDLSHNLLTTDSLVPEIFDGHFSPSAYEPMEHLRVLRLGANKLHSLNSDLFEHLPALEVLSLELNQFKVIDSQTDTAISGISTLVSLDLSYMELEEIPKFLLHTPRGLRYLNLTGNLLKEVPPALTYAVGLNWLSLDENPIETIVAGNEFPVMKNLTYLGLSYMPALKVIGRGAFRGLESLQELYLANNPHLGYLHAEAFSRNDTDNPERLIWPPVRRLYLHNNDLKYLDAQLLVQWDAMEVIDIRVNPWACDCANRWVVSTLLPIVERITPTILNNIVCSSPPQMAGASMIDLEHHHTKLRCLDTAGNNPSNDGALLVGLLIGVLAAAPLTAGLWCIYKRGCFGLFRDKGPAGYSRAFYSRTTLNEEF